MLQLLLFIKHHCSFLWSFVEFCNGSAFAIFFRARFRRVTTEICQNVSSEKFHFRPLVIGDLEQLQEFFAAQPKTSYEYFKPHKFDLKTLKRLERNPAFCMFGTFEGERLTGYSLLRFFCNRQAFAGFLVNEQDRGRGIAKLMGRSMLKICWTCGFRVFATVSRRNTSALASYRAINDFRIIRELPDDYIYIEYMQNGAK